MKNINIIPGITITSMLIFSLLTACSDDELVEIPRDSLSPENLFVSTGGFESALTAVYERVRRERSLVSKLPSMFTGTDISYSEFSHPAVRPLQTYGAAVTPTFQPAREWWADTYQTISWTNLIIERTQNDIKWDSPDDGARITAEARFFRAYTHNILTTLFGDVPIVDEFFVEAKLDFVRAPQKQVLEFVRDDLVFAAANLPADPGSVQRGKLTRFAALHLLAEVYLHLGEFALAESAAQEVIDGPFQLMTSRFGPEANDPKGNVFHDLFLEKNVDYQDGNLETIWAIEKEFETIGGDSGRGDYTRRILTPFYQRYPGLQIADSLGGRGVGRVAPTQAYLDLYDSGDIRNDNINIRRKWYYNDPAGLPSGKQIGDLIVLDPADPNHQRYLTIDLFPQITKWNFGVQSRGGSSRFVSTVKDHAQYRLAETYLLLAEAQHLQGNNAGAAAALTTLRARSNASAVNPGDVDMNYILDERARELYGEVYRRHTLSRTGMFLERVRAMNPQVAGAVTDRDKLFPIPQTVIDGNPEADFPQNPGY